MDVPMLANQQELTYNRSVQTQDVVWKTCWEEYDERESGKSLFAARHDDDDDDFCQVQMIWTHLYGLKYPYIIIKWFQVIISILS